MLRTARPSDAESLAAMHRACFDDPWSAGDLRAMLDSSGGYGVIAPGQGFAIARVAADEAELVSIGVLPERRGNGRGRALLDAVMRRAAERGAVQMHLEVAVDNPEAHGLYERAGFTQAGRRRAYYQRADGRVDALVLTCVLSSPPS